MNAAWFKARWLLNRRTARTLLWTVLLLAMAVAANVAGIYVIGSIAGWEQWLAEASAFFLLWRLCLYGATARSEEHTSELQSLMRISYAVFCLEKKKCKPTHQL